MGLEQYRGTCAFCSILWNRDDLKKDTFTSPIIHPKFREFGPISEPIQKLSGCPSAGWVLIRGESLVICTPVHGSSQSTPGTGLAAFRSVLDSTRKTLCRRERATLGTGHTENDSPSRAARQDLVTQRARTRHWGWGRLSAPLNTAQQANTGAGHWKLKGHSHRKQIWGKGSNCIQAGGSGPECVHSCCLLMNTMDDSSLNHWLRTNRRGWGGKGKSGTKILQCRKKKDFWTILRKADVWMWSNSRFKRNSENWKRNNKE